MYNSTDCGGVYLGNMASSTKRSREYEYSTECDILVVNMIALARLCVVQRFDGTQCAFLCQSAGMLIHFNTIFA